MQSLLQPQEPNARLKRAAKAHLRRGGQRTGAWPVALTSMGLTQVDAFHFIFTSRPPRRL